MQIHRGKYRHHKLELEIPKTLSYSEQTQLREGESLQAHCLPPGWILGCDGFVWFRG